MKPVSYRAMYIALGIYLAMSPLGLYNTLALFGLVEARFVTLQIAMTASMIIFAIIASQPLGKHCENHPELRSTYKTFWKIGFYTIGPPVLYAYYWFLYRERVELS
jgi:hypothetical protein